MTGPAPQAAPLPWANDPVIPPGAKPKEMGWGEFIDNIGRKIASGATLGWADEAAAGMDALTQPVLGRGSEAPSMGERYGQNLAKEQGRDKAFDAEYPKTSTAAEVGGNVAGAVATPMSRAFEAATVPGRMLKGAVGGAGIGAIAGAGGSDPGKRIEGAVTGAEFGAPLGGAIPAVGALAERVGPRILDALGMRNPDKGAVQQLLRAAERDGVSPDEAMKRYTAWQQSGAKPEALVDLFGENVRNLAAVASNTPGQARQAAMDLVTARKASQPERVGGDIGRAISPSTDYAGTVDDLMRSRKTAADPLYQKMRQAPTYWDPDLEGLMKRPSMKEAWAKAQRLASEEGVDLPKVWALDAEGNMVRTGESRPDWASWDYIKRGLDEVIEGHKDQFGKMTDTGRTTTGTRQALLDILDKANPDYKAARAAYSGPSQSIDAMKLGRSIFAEDADISAKKIAALDPGDKEFFRAGVAKAVQDKIENTADGRDVVASFFNKPALRKKLEAAFDSPEQFKSFEDLMTRERSMASTNNIVNPRGGSQTGRLAAGGEDAQTDPVSAFANLLHGNMTGAVRAMAPGLRGNQGMNSATADALAPLLFKTDPADVTATLNRLSTSGPQYPAISDARQAIARALMGPVPAMQAGDLGASKRPLRIEARPPPLRSVSANN